MKPIARWLMAFACAFSLVGVSGQVQAHAPSAAEHARDSELARQIQRLQRAAAKKPTTRANVHSRLETFWRWANDYTLAGHAIDPDVPATVARIRDPGPRSQIAEQDLSDIDRWIREFTYREQNPGAVGHLSSPKLSGFEVDAFHELRVDYEIGERALTTGDGFVLGELTYGKGPRLQGSDPQGDHFVSISSSVDGVEFEVDGYPIRGMFSGTMQRSVVMTGAARKVFFRVKKGRLPAGSTVTIRLGDQSYGSKGLGLIAPSVDALRFRVWLHLQQEQLLMAMPELSFQSVGGKATGVRGFGPSIVTPGEPFDLTVRFEDQFRNLAQGAFPAAEVVSGDRVLARIPQGTNGIVKVPKLALADVGIHRLQVRAQGLVDVGEVNPILVEADPILRLYWGETHGHSGFSEGMGSVDGVYQFARDQARLDFMALTEHDYWMDDAEWEVLRSAAQKYSSEGEFLAFLAYEWTVHSKNGGHHNVLFRTPEGRRRVPRQEVQTLAELYRALHKVAKPEDLLLIPHAHNPGDWGQSDAQTQRFVEIVSLHGTFEWFGRRYLDEGFMVGFLGGSDDHMGHPGLRPLRRNPTSDNLGGLLGLYAASKTNDAVFDAMRNTQGYATNGVRSILKLKLNDAPMGSLLPPAQSAKFRGSVHGTAPIEQLMLWKNGEVVYVEDYAEVVGTQAVESEYFEIRFWSDSYPRAKGALARQWRRWRGTLEVVGGDILELSSPQNDNPYTEYAKFRDDDRSIVDFFLKTRGSYKSVLVRVKPGQGDVNIRLSGIKESPLPLEAIQQYSAKYSLAEIGDSPLRVDVPVEDYDDHFLVRKVRPPQSLDRKIVIDHASPAVAGDYYYLRVRQSDGGLVWSSPFRIE